MLRTTIERPLTRRLSMDSKIVMAVASTSHLSQLGSRCFERGDRAEGYAMS